VALQRQARPVRWRFLEAKTWSRSARPATIPPRHAAHRPSSSRRRTSTQPALQVRVQPGCAPTPPRAGTRTCGAVVRTQHAELAVDASDLQVVDAADFGDGRVDERGDRRPSGRRVGIDAAARSSAAEASSASAGRSRSRWSARAPWASRPRSAVRLVRPLPCTPTRRARFARRSSAGGSTARGHTIARADPLNRLEWWGCGRVVCAHADDAVEEAACPGHRRCWANESRAGGQARCPSPAHKAAPAPTRPDPRTADQPRRGACIIPRTAGRTSGRSPAHPARSGPATRPAPGGSHTASS
jgi:hypothetical protein